MHGQYEATTGKEQETKNTEVFSKISKPTLQFTEVSQGNLLQEKGDSEPLEVLLAAYYNDVNTEVCEISSVGDQQG
jgi:hypothetical protein